MNKQPETVGAAGQLAKDNRILVISKVGCPPPHRGNRARMAALLLEMRRLGYAVHFAGVRMTAEEKAATLPMVDKWVGDFEAPPSPVGFARLGSSLKYRALHLLRRFHFLHDKLDDMFFDHWLEEARTLQKTGNYSIVLVPYVFHSKFLEAFPDSCLKILDTIDAFSIRRTRPKSGKTGGDSRSYSLDDEKRGLLRAQRIIAIQEQEATYFQRLLGSAGKVYTVGHFTDGLSQPLPPAAFLRLGCIGSSTSFNSQGIQWFLNEIWPIVRNRFSNAEVWVAGDMGAKCQPAPGLRILGHVARLEDFYRDCPILFNPVRMGTGLKIKTIEALMHGRPVVTTSVGAEGLESFLEEGLFIGDSAEEFSRAAIRLLSDLPQAQLLGEAALRRVHGYAAANRCVFAEVLVK